jgi:hypothetical protein
MIGSLKFYVVQLDGSSVDITLKEVKCVPESWLNLFRIIIALNNGFDLSNQILMIRMKK